VPAGFEKVAQPGTGLRGERGGRKPDGVEAKAKGAVANGGGYVGLFYFPPSP
jgi:hypothetical protein